MISMSCVGHQNIWSLAVLINGNGGNEILICYTVGDEGFKYFEIYARPSLGSFP
jgi:hypothetical protein